MNKSLFIIGGQRSGTSFLRDILVQHPKIKFAKPYNPEPKYFLNEPLGTYRSFVSKYFANLEPDIVIAEKSTSYFEFEHSLRRIQQEMNPDVVIYVVRNPIDRAMSNYKFSVKNKLETRSLEEVFYLDTPKPKLNKTFSTDPFNYLGRSQLSRIIPFLESIFEENLLLVDFNKLIDSPAEVTSSIIEPLNLQPIKIEADIDINHSYPQILSNREEEIISRKLASELSFYYHLQSTKKI